jgi:hypothetical protein
MTRTSYFGSTEHYYSNPQPKIKHGLSRQEQEICDMLLRYHKNLKQRVERTCKQMNQTIRTQIRTETGLRLTSSDDSQAVPVRVVDGLPLPFADALASVETPILMELLLNMRTLLSTVDGLRLVQKNYNNIRQWQVLINDTCTSHELNQAKQFVENLLSGLEGIQLLERIRNINEDVLGAYFFRIPEVHIYWMAIGIGAQILNVSIESLTLVTLIHELAHAYCHLGYDIDEMKWDTETFAKTDVNIVEGLAQFYTSVITEKFIRKDPAVKLTFEKLLKMQSTPYRSFLDWPGSSDRAGEVVRISLLESRSQKIMGYDKYLASLALSEERIGRGRIKQPRLFT